MSVESRKIVFLTADSRHKLESLLGPCDKVSVGPVAPSALVVEGNTHTRRLNVTATCYLYPGEGRSVPLQIELVSQGWPVQGLLPPVGREIPDLTSELEDRFGSPLCFELHVHNVPLAKERGDRPWMKLLQPAFQDGVVTGDQAVSSAPEMLEEALSRWLGERFGVSTVEQAIAVATSGAFGHFGALETWVLPRSGQADLEVDATLLGRVDNANDVAGLNLPVVSLALYGERYGLWLLHRRYEYPLKMAAKLGGSSRIKDELIISDSSEGLREQAGMDDLSKQLYQQVGILPHATLWVGSSFSSEPDESETENAEVSTPLDITSLPDKAKRQLRTVVSLLEKGTIDSVDIEMLLRLARHFTRRR